MSRVAVIGAGYVGLTTACCFAHLEHRVVCADIDRRRVEMLQRGEVPILEDRLESLLRAGLEDGSLEFVTGAANAVADAEFVYLCVPTPQSENGAADLSYIRAAVSEIRDIIPSGAIVVTKSTVPIGSASVVEEVLQRPDVSVVSNPEFLREGTAVHDFLHPDRVVVGAEPRGGGAGRLPVPRPGLPHHRHRPGVGGDHQVRVELLPRHEGVVRQRHRRRVRSRRGGCPRRAARHGLRHPHRPAVPPARSRVGRVVLPQGRRRADVHRRGGRLRLPPPRGRRPRERGAVRADGGQGRSRPSGRH